MASNVITCSLLASPLASNKASLNPSKINLGPQSIAFRGPTSSKTTLSSRVLSLVVRAQQDEGGMSKDDQRVATIIDTSSYMRTPWSITENENEIRMWVDMRMDVNVVDNKLIIKGTEGTVDGKQNPSPFDCKVQLPLNCAKEKTEAVFNNGVFNIYVPKITKTNPSTYVHVPVRGL